MFSYDDSDYCQFTDLREGTAYASCSEASTEKELHKYTLRDLGMISQLNDAPCTVHPGIKRVSNKSNVQR